MEKLFYLLFMLPTLALAQIEVDDQWKTSVNPIFQNLDKNKIQYAHKSDAKSRNMTKIEFLLL